MYPFHDANSYIKDVTLNVTSLENSTKFYKDLLGLEVISEEQYLVHLGTNNQRVVSLRKVDNKHRNQEGLFHVAYLFPSMKLLASWLDYHIKKKTPLSGASDHEVSHAIYLEDPDGNGIEVYADTPQESWDIKNRTINMVTRALDINGLLLQKEEDWENITPELKVGHVHLRAKNHREAKRFYEVIGLDQTFDYGSASFLSYEGYHHHIAINQWGTTHASGHDDEVADLYHMTIFTPHVEFMQQRLSKANIPFREENGELILKDFIGIHLTITTKEK
jgi:catechol 2,3-dioxygenase